MAINWLTENFAGLFDVINHIVGGFIDGFQGILMWVPFYLMIGRNSSFGLVESQERELLS